MEVTHTQNPKWTPAPFFSLPLLCLALCWIVHTSTCIAITKHFSLCSLPGHRDSRHSHWEQHAEQNEKISTNREEKLPKSIEKVEVWHWQAITGKRRCGGIKRPDPSLCHFFSFFACHCYICSLAFIDQQGSCVMCDPLLETSTILTLSYPHFTFVESALNLANQAAFNWFKYCWGYFMFPQIFFSINTYICTK